MSRAASRRRGRAAAASRSRRARLGPPPPPPPDPSPTRPGRPPPAPHPPRRTRTRLAAGRERRPPPPHPPPRRSRERRVILPTARATTRGEPPGVTILDRVPSQAGPGADVAFTQTRILGDHDPRRSAQLGGLTGPDQGPGPHRTDSRHPPRRGTPPPAPH